MTSEAATARFDPEPRCAAEARRFVLDFATCHGLDRFADDAALCTSELTANAVLHSRTPFTVSVRAIITGLRIDVHDELPDRLPAEVPEEIDPLDTGTTGRGLRLVGALAARWGYFTTDVAKTVWVELADRKRDRSGEPIVELARRPAPSGRRVRIIDLPVRAAVASGVQIDDMVRLLQLEPSNLSEEERVTFYKLLDRSAGPRLTGRHEAFRAAGALQQRCTFELFITTDEHAALVELVQFLGQSPVCWSDELDPAGADVAAMRAWLPLEVAAQLRGEPPTAYPA